MVLASCHPGRRHYARGQCFDCYVRLTWKGNSKAKAGARAKQRRREKLATRAGRSVRGSRPSEWTCSSRE